MSGIKKLAGQTLWYGVSSIAARFLNYLLTPYLTNASVLKETAYGEMSIIYAAIPFLNIIFTYGLETAYFRFSKSKEEEVEVYSTSTLSLIGSTVLFTSILLFFRQPLATLLGVEKHPEYMTMAAFIIAFDALGALAFAKLRYQSKPRKFALIRIASIVINIGLTIFFLSACPSLQAKNPNSFIGVWYNKSFGVGYILLANLLQSVFTLLFLSKEFFSFKLRFNAKLWKEIILYASPLILAGFAGMINETFDRIMLKWWSSAPTESAAKVQVAIYSACYKLSILITLSVQAFRMAAEPFFFSAAQGQQPQKIYARVMKFFVITVCFMFLAVVLFLDIWKHFITNPVYWQGLGVVPVLLLANMFLGIYYNLSIWYKLSNKTMAGAWITLIGALITLLINAVFIPYFGYYACAWATFFCYGSMMVTSFVWGQKAYRVPYAWKKLVAYILICVAFFGLHSAFGLLHLNEWINRAFGALLFFIFAWFIGLVEGKELAKLPFVGKFFGQAPLPPNGGLAGTQRPA
ncbi:oligosaccharide flippase family protein [Flavisolibacter nicotianae]|uniref:oligosaccharide flippase family protein n=1 Tax=Flavisolibacter nicotianae TaxID=2364882 RepID=UPI001F09A1E0|nr:oligosaccharide flippase family protein [Flavisolibacter nicotianae]